MTSYTPARVHAATANCVRGSVRNRRLATAVLGIGGVALVGSGAFAAWQTTQNVTSGTVGAATAGLTILDANGTVFSSGVPNLLPGDYFYRYVDVRNDGTTDAAFTGTTGATGDLLGYVSAQVDRCSVAWSTVGGASTCAGSVTSVAVEGTIPGGGANQSLGTIAPGSLNAAHVRYRFKLADAAPSSLQGGSSAVTISANATTTGGRDRTAS